MRAAGGRRRARWGVDRSEVELRAEGDAVEPVFALVDRPGRGRLGERGERAALHFGADRLQDEADIALRNPGQAELVAGLLAAPRQAVRRSDGAVGDGVGEAVLELAAVEIEIVVAQIDLERAPAALVEGA